MLTKKWGGLVLGLGFSVAASATTYDVMTGKFLHKSSMSTMESPTHSFTQADQVNAFVTLRDLGENPPKIMEAQWFHCGTLVSRRDFAPQNIGSHVKTDEHHVWFWMDAKSLDAGDDRVDIYADGNKVGSAQFNVADESGNAGKCPAAAIEKVGNVVEEPIVLDSDAVFHFNGSKPGDMYAASDAKIDAVVNRIQTEFSRIDGITVLGYTDYLGSEEYNANLSQMRANTIRDLLIKRGVPAARITAKGRGESNPIKLCDEKLDKKSLQECLAPNRRVEVVVRGTKR